MGVTPPSTSCADRDREALLAQDLLLVSIGSELAGEPTSWASVNCVVIGALIAELVQRGHVVIGFSSELGEETITVIDAGPSGDEVLDLVLHVLGGGHVTALKPEASRGARFWGWRARRRLLRTGRVGRRDLMRWWEGCWTCREFGQLAPTLLQQLLTLYEELWAVHERLHERIGVQPAAPDFGVDRATCQLVRDRFRAEALGAHAPVDDRERYVVALCGGWQPTWFAESLFDDGAERSAAYRRGQPLRQNDALAQAVVLVIERYEAQFDC